MSPEEFERLKAEEKAHLREMRRLKGLARAAEQKGRVAQAFEKIVGGSAGALDALEQAMGRVAQGNAQSEARFEIATEGLESEPDEDALRAARARALVEQMKGELSAPPRPAAPAAREAPAQSASDTASAKTIGRTPPPAGDVPDDASADTPTKTLGRRA